MVDRVLAVQHFRPRVLEHTLRFARVLDRDDRVVQTMRDRDQMLRDRDEVTRQRDEMLRDRDRSFRAIIRW